MIVHPSLKERGSIKDSSRRSPEDALEEAAGLARAIHLDIVGMYPVRMASINPSMLLGKGTVETIGKMVEELKPSVVIVDHSLSPVQQRNLEKAWKAKVIDRTGLILEIFGARAQTKEGKIQVDLAALEYERSRLVRSWTHLERQRGGTGTTGGPGETQLEMDRRMISDRIAQLKKDLEKVRRMREVGRKSRERVPFPVIALVGYTNAGKSTLFNRLTGAEVFAKDLLFATLDPTLRRIELPSGQPAILSDTVGFIADLPTNLVASFRATLEQIQYADVILHVRDICRPDHEAQKADVIKVLADLDIDYDGDERVFEALNKIDACSPDHRTDVLRAAGMSPRRFAVSAVTGEGTEALLEAIDGFLTRRRRALRYTLPVTAGEALSWLYRHGEVIKRTDEGEAIRLEVRLEPDLAARFAKQFEFRAEGEQEQDHEE